MKYKLLLATILLSTSLAHAECYSDGIRVGTIQKFSKKGYMSKSWEGEMVMQGFTANRVKATDIWKFSTLDPSVANEIENAMMSGKQTSLKYCQRNPVLPHLDIDTTYEVTKAKIQ